MSAPPVLLEPLFSDSSVGQSIRLLSEGSWVQSPLREPCDCAVPNTQAKGCSGRVRSGSSHELLHGASRVTADLHCFRAIRGVRGPPTVTSWGRGQRSRDTGLSRQRKRVRVPSIPPFTTSRRAS